MRIVSNNPEIQARYEKSKAAGAPDWLAEIYAFRRGPGSCVEGRDLHRGGKLLADQFQGDERSLKLLKANARKMGITLSASSRYVGDFAQFPCDPRACISASDPVGNVKHLCKKNKGWQYKGNLNVHATVDN
jgi:hypothetical protein